MQKNWFKSWFDSPYYHLLYNHRDYSEAEFFIANLFSFLSPKKNSKVLDLACGKGRHALQIHQFGNDVLGVDLSPKSIEAANEMKDRGLAFETGDMRELSYIDEFDIVVNLFTSFGYFQQEGDNVKVITSIAKALKSNGILVLDYLNVTKVEKTLPIELYIERGEITFKVNKSVKGSFIVKDISFSDNGEAFSFQEHVKRFTEKHFREIFSDCGLEIQNVFGNYDLNIFDEKTSDRLILIAKKK